MLEDVSQVWLKGKMASLFESGAIKNELEVPNKVIVDLDL